MITQRAANILFSGARVFWALTDQAKVLPTIAYGAAHDPANWHYIGYTSAPTTVQVTREVEEVKVEQAMGTVRREVIEEKVAIETVMAEVTAANLALSWGGTAATVAGVAGATVPYEELWGGGSDSLPAVQWMIEGKHKSKIGGIHPVRLFLRQGVAAVGAELKFARTEAAGIALHIDGDHVTETDLGVAIAEGQQLYYFYRVTGPVPSA